MLARRGARRPARRPAATIVEMAVILSVLFLVLFALILGAIGVFRYQQVAQLAREGSRYASVHGATWATENKQPPTTPQDVYDKSVRPRATNMDPALLGCAVTWNQDQRPAHVEVRGDDVVTVANYVSVTVEYKWDAFLIGPVTLRSTSVSMMHY